ncbi:MAG TPA: hypothetical protein VLJ79_08520 [Candidatus Binatia bacterium]|nr:hypothetical protein [Candidatus Binatia bacterium]
MKTNLKRKNHGLEEKRSAAQGRFWAEKLRPSSPRQRILPGIPFMRVTLWITTAVHLDTRSR